MANWPWPWRTSKPTTTYWTPAHDTCTAECHAEWRDADAEREAAWETFKHAPPPVGCDPAIVPDWKEGPRSVEFAVLRLSPWRLRVFPGSILVGKGGRVLTWKAPGP